MVEPVLSIFGYKRPGISPNGREGKENRLE